jgi:hypothetical protein
LSPLLLLILSGAAASAENAPPGSDPDKRAAQVGAAMTQAEKSHAVERGEPR